MKFGIIIGRVLFPLLCVAQFLSRPVDASNNRDVHSAYSSGTEKVVEDWQQALPNSFRKIAVLSEPDFISAWQADLDYWVSRLREVPGYDPSSSEAERYQARIFYEWALGRFYYPSAHAALAGVPDFTPSPDYKAYEQQLDFTRGDFLDLDEYTTILRAFRNQVSNRIKRDLGDQLNNGTRDLTSRLFENKEFDPAIRCYLDRQAINYWLENFAADGLTTEVDQLADRCPGLETDKIVKAYQQELAERNGHSIEVFKTVDGHDLELHIYQPENASGPVPATIWVHGGGWRTGSWSWCGPCVWMKERGHVVVQVEYRLNSRHGTSIGDAYADAVSALTWTHENAARFGIDPDRIAMAGFSAGAHLSLAVEAIGDGPYSPGLVMAFSPCTDLVIDPYTVDLAGGEDKARALSPVNHISADMAPIFVASADQDRVCNFAASETFVTKATQMGANVTFVKQSGAGHFFLRDPKRASETKEMVNQFLTINGF